MQNSIDKAYFFHYNDFIDIFSTPYNANHYKNQEKFRLKLH